MRYQWEFRRYQRRFKQALQTSHGSWSLREGILLRLVDDAGNVGWGEIAPIHWFGSETVEQALEFCHQLPTTLTDDRIFSTPNTLPSCQFGFESAWEAMREQAIGSTATHQRINAQNQAVLATENSIPQPQNSEWRPKGSVSAVQNSDVAVPSSTLRLQNSEIAVQNATLRPPSSIVAAPSSEIAVQNATLRLQNSEIAIQNSDVAVPSSTLRPQNSKLELHSVLHTPHRSAERSRRSPTPHTPHPTPHTLLPTYSALLPPGKAALHAWKPLWEQGFRTFKWKIGVQPIATEFELLHSLTQNLPAPANLRLDANGGLSLEDASRWLETCDAIAADSSLPVTVEYLEQPLDISQFQAMQRLSDRYTTPIALDESVATLQQLQACYENGWRGIFVIKPAIVGSPKRLRQFCQQHAIDAVFSSAFETAIGRQAGLRLAAALGNPDRARGYGTTHWFDEAETTDFEQLWQTL